MATKFLSLVTANLTKFTGQNKVYFTADYPQRLGDKIAKAKSILSDHALRGIAGSSTENFTAVAEKFKEAHNSLSYFVKRIVGVTPMLVTQFRANGLSNIFKQRNELVLFARDAVSLVESHKDALIAAGMPDTLPSEIAALADQPETAREDKFDKVIGRHQATHDRSDATDALRYELHEIKEAASHIYPAGSGDLIQFDLPPQPKSSGKSDNGTGKTDSGTSATGTEPAK